MLQTSSCPIWPPSVACMPLPLGCWRLSEAGCDGWELLIMYPVSTKGMATGKAGCFPIVSHFQQNALMGSYRLPGRGRTRFRKEKTEIYSCICDLSGAWAIPKAQRDRYEPAPQSPIRFSHRNSLSLQSVENPFHNTEKYPLFMLPSISYEIRH